MWRRHIVWHPLYVEYKKKWHKWTYLQNRKRFKLRKWTHGCHREGIVREFGKVMYTLIYFKWITIKSLLYSIWSSLQCYVLAWMGGSFGGERLHVWRPFFTIHLKLTQHCQLAITQYKLLLELKKKKKINLLCVTHSKVTITLWSSYYSHLHFTEEAQRGKVMKSQLLGPVSWTPVHLDFTMKSFRYPQTGREMISWGLR